MRWPSLPLRFAPARALLIALSLAGLVVGACALPAASPTPGTPAPTVALTRVVSVNTNTPTQPPPTATATITPTPSSTPTETPVPPTPTATEPPVVEFMAVGDLMLARSIGERIEAVGPEVVFAGVADALAEADLLAGNLECVISDVGTPEPKGYVFRAPPPAADALALAGFDVVSLANNHALDYGIEALGDMLPRLRERGIASVGAGADDEGARAPAILTHNGLRVAFLAYVDVPVEGRTGFDTRAWAAAPFKPGVAWADPAAITVDVASARLSADVVVVMLHFGLENRREVTASQAEHARAAIDAGAALVLGAHPHVLQLVEEYNGGVIAYSLGNFVFDGFDQSANYSAIFRATLTPEGVADYGWLPVVVDRGLPRLATDAEAEVVHARLLGR